MHRPSTFVCIPAHRGCPLLLMAVVSQGREWSWVAGFCHRHDDRAHSVRASSDWILVSADEESAPTRARQLMCVPLNFDAALDREQPVQFGFNGDGHWRLLPASELCVRHYLHSHYEICSRSPADCHDIASSCAETKVLLSHRSQAYGSEQTPWRRWSASSGMAESSSEAIRMAGVCGSASLPSGHCMWTAGTLTCRRAVRDCPPYG
jgi:hypothetical protein